MTKLYHADLFVPPSVAQQANQLAFDRLDYSGHAKQAFLDDRYGRVAAPSTLRVSEWTGVEIEAVDGNVTKVVVRRPVDAFRSLVLVVRPQSATTGKVVTAWINRNDDNHNTLDIRKYARN